MKIGNGVKLIIKGRTYRNEVPDVVATEAGLMEAPKPKEPKKPKKGE